MVVEIIVLDVCVLFWVAYAIRKQQSDSVRIFFWPALIAKLMAGIGVGLVYFYHYGVGDTISYWEDGKQVSDMLLSNPGGALKFFWNEHADTSINIGNLRPRSLFFVKISGVLALIAGGNYWMMSLIISFVSFLGAWYLFVRTTKYFPSAKAAASIAFLFYPSVVFWSSGLIKESLGLSALFFLSGLFLTVSHQQKLRWWEWVFIPISVWLCWNLKYYWLGVFIPVVITTSIIIVLRRKFISVERFDIAAWMGVFTIVFLLGTSFHPNFYPSRFIEVIVQNNREYMALSNPENAVHYHELEQTLSSMVLNAPQAWVAGFFRPFFWEGHNPISMVAGLENFIFLLLVLTATPALLRLFKSPDRLMGLSVISYCVILAIFLALSTPNFGTLSRYKIGFLPFMLFLVIYKNPIIHWFTRRSKI